MEDYGKDVLGQFRDGKIVCPKGASTRTRCHELGHKILGYEPGTMKVSELVSQELDAEIFAWEAMGKILRPRVAVPVLSELVNIFGYS